jgi:hypothetical protein
VPEQDIPTKQQMAWAGRSWDRLSARECGGIAYAAFGGFMAEALEGYVWERIGDANQIELARVMLRLEEHLRKAYR